MFTSYRSVRRISGVLLPLFIFGACLPPCTAHAQTPITAHTQTPINSGVHFDVQQAQQRLDMIVNTSRIVRMSVEIPRVQIGNEEIVKVTPLSPNELQVAALRPGVTQLNLFDKQGRIYSIDVIVTPDARELQLLLESEFPNSSLRVRPLASKVVITGYVDRPDVVPRIIEMAKDYYPDVIDNITVGGVQTVQLDVKIMEVSRTKLREFGFDWAVVSGNDFVVQSVSGLIDAAATAGGVATGLGGDTVRFGIVDSSSFFGFIRALRQYNLLKILAEPTLTTVSGRPASFNVGGEFPILVPQSLGTVSIEFKEFGTRVDFVPITLGNGNLRLEVRPMVSEIDSSRSVTVNDITVPGLRTRWVDTAVEMRSGQTLALAGLIQERVESENVGVPWVSDLPWVGAGFRRVKEEVNEIELLVMVTPRLVNAMEPHQVPPCGPGTRTTNPNDVELYWKGYLEVPKCCPPGQEYTQQYQPQPGEPMPMPQPQLTPDQIDAMPREIQPAPAAARRYDIEASRSRVSPSDIARSRQLPPQLGPNFPHRSVAPIGTGTDPNNRHNPLTQPSQIRPTSAQEDPGLIGPVGFDVLNY